MRILKAMAARSGRERKENLVKGEKLQGRVGVGLGLERRVRIRAGLIRWLGWRIVCTEY